jgi:hypothetical protein
MDRDEPEQRMADLKDQLAQRNRDAELRDRNLLSAIPGVVIAVVAAVIMVGQLFLAQPQNVFTK